MFEPPLFQRFHDGSLEKRYSHCAHEFCFLEKLVGFAIFFPFFLPVTPPNKKARHNKIEIKLNNKQKSALPIEIKVQGKI